MPVPHGDARLLAQVGEAEELVVDQRLRGADVDGAHAGGRVLPELGEYGEERRLGFSRRGLSGKKDVVLGVEDCLARCHLDAAQALPLVVVDEVLDKGRVVVEDAHGRA